MHLAGVLQDGLLREMSWQAFEAVMRPKVAGLRALVNEQVGAGVVAARLDWNKVGNDLSGNRSNVNALTSDRLTDIGGGATFYSTLVEVRRVGGAAGE